jgi:hypothetical protein
MEDERSKRIMAQVFSVMQEFNERTGHVNWTEYASKAFPMNLRSTLVEEAKKRYEPGKGPWGKDMGELDQVDLVWFEELAKPYGIYSDPRGWLSGAIKVLVAEVRDTRGWPTPPDVEPQVEYVDMSNDSES